MYIPTFTAVTDPELLHDLMRRFSFATFVTAHDGRPFATHLPFLFSPEEGEQGTLVAHMARANPQWRGFADGSEALVIFQGPHTYVSPSWYEEEVSVPTWNYAVAHAYGVPRVITDAGRVREILRALVDTHEEGFEEPWEMELPEDYLQRQLRAIVAFEVPITRLEGKFKLSQNRSAGDQQRVSDQLATCPDANAQAVQEMMQALARRESATPRRKVGACKSPAADQSPGLAPGAVWEEC
jgi:transcriptional regulator